VLECLTDPLLAATDIVAGDPITVIGGILATALTALTGVQTAQMSGLRHDFQAYRTDQDAKMRKLEEAHRLLGEQVEDLQERTPIEPVRRKNSSQSTTTRGRRPARSPAA